jgi:multiple sugar transport system permease protein
MEEREWFILKRFSRSMLIYFTAGVVLILSMFPLVWVLLTSIKYPIDAFSLPPKIIFEPTLSNYANLFEYSSIFRNFLNSFIVAVSTTFLALVIGVPAAYSFSRFRFPKRKHVAFWILTTRMAPAVAALIPLYLFWLKLGLLDTHLALIVTYLTFNLSFVIWLMRGFFVAIPRDLDDAAMVDGLTRGQAFRKIILPIAIPGLATTSILSFIWSWNEFVFAFFLTSYRSQTLPVAIVSFYGSNQQTGWGEMSATSVIMMIPVLIFVFFVRRYLVTGLTFGLVSKD